MKDKIESIERFFSKKEITLKENLENIKSTEMKESVTNKFFPVESKKNEKYLIRINGKLWPPFTRESEHHNLKELKKNKIETTVFTNSYKNGWQICKITEGKSFSEITTEKRKKYLKKLSISIKKYQKIKNFQNNYSLPNTIENSMLSLKSKNTQKIRDYYEIILSMAIVLHLDEKNQIFSHNDLLPSSIYFSKKNAHIVDWEYSGRNHRCYDLSLFSIKSTLSETEEEKLTYYYDYLNQHDTQYCFTLMKPVVNFLLLIWSMPRQTENSEIAQSSLYINMLIYIQNAITYQSIRNKAYIPLTTSEDLLEEDLVENHSKP